LVEDLQVIFDFAREGARIRREVDKNYADCLSAIEALELKNMLRKEEDKLGAIMKINSGAAEPRAWTGRPCLCVCICAMVSEMVTR
jgi:hypothetical protein